jgi:hypothetical protein
MMQFTSNLYISSDPPRLHSGAMLSNTKVFPTELYCVMRATYVLTFLLNHSYSKKPLGKFRELSI